MADFQFSRTIVSGITEEIRQAKEFVKIAIFQLHNDSIFDELVQRLSESVNVHIITLPYDSINEDVRQRVETRFGELIEAGARVDLIKWNVGDPQRTTTAVGRWYAFHGKFMVTDRAAIALSANLMDQNELDAMVKFEDESSIALFLSQFNYLIDTFIARDGRALRDMVNEEAGPNHELFELPPVIQNQIHTGFWITDYPASLCAETDDIGEGLYIAPFHVRARTLYENTINDAESYAYISTESFTDQDFTRFLIRRVLHRKMDIKVLTGARAMDFADRVNLMLKELLANSVQVRRISYDLHCKLLVTDRRLILGSVNLNRMNLGFARTSRLWRANTESLLVSTDRHLLEQCAEGFLRVFGEASDVTEDLAARQTAKVTELLHGTFGLRSNNEVKALFAKLIVNCTIEAEAFAYRLARTTAMVSRKAERTTVSKDDFVRSVVLHYLSERKHDKGQLREKLLPIDAQDMLDGAIEWLLHNEFIERQQDFYKIKIDTLF